MRSAFNGHIKEIPFILVDNFENDLDKNAYFLSHYHGDHVFGLAEELLRVRLKRNNVFIYGSKVTIAIIKEQCPKLTPYLKVLKLGTNTVTIKRENEEIFLEVVTLPAGHSLGSVMFLFKYEKKNILYTGDFRITRNSVAKYSHLHNKGEPIRLDVLYVDTTFQNFPMFPKRSEVVRNIIFHIKNWLNQSEKHNVVLLTSAGFGYENICNEIFNETKIKTYVGDSFWRIYSQFPKEIYGMTNNASSRIYLRTKYSYKTDPSPLTLQVYFSAYKWGDKQNIDEEYLTIQDNRIDVCFSTHCGRDELIYFINYFKPIKIIGFPEPYNLKICLDFIQDDFPDEQEKVGEFKIEIKKRKRSSDAVSKRVSKRVSGTLLGEAFNW